MDVGYFRIDFQVNYRFRHTRIGPIIFVFMTRSGNGRARNIMRSTFLSAKEYRDFAAQCLRWASRGGEHGNVLALRRWWRCGNDRVQRTPGECREHERDKLSRVESIELH